MSELEKFVLNKFFQRRVTALTNTKAESHEEKIICPNCGSIETATVKHTIPWWTYFHICSKCENTIMESEWNKYKEEVCQKK